MGRREEGKKGSREAGKQGSREAGKQERRKEGKKERRKEGKKERREAGKEPWTPRPVAIPVRRIWALKNVCCALLRGHWCQPSQAFLLCFESSFGLWLFASGFWMLALGF